MKEIHPWLPWKLENLIVLYMLDNQFTSCNLIFQGRARIHQDVDDFSPHLGEPLPPNILAKDSLMKTLYQVESITS